MRNLVLAFTLLLPLAASATDEDYLRFYNAALRLHESLEYERALEQLALARKQATSGDQMSQVSLAEGVVLADMNRSEEAMAAFKQGLLLSPDAKLPIKVSPRVAGEVETVRAKVKKELAPLIAKQEEEKRRAEEDKKKQEEIARARAEAEAKKAEAEAKAREAARLENEKQKAEADAKTKEAARLLAEADAKLKEIARLEEERKKAKDAPVNVTIHPPDNQQIVEPPIVPVVAPSKAPMVMTFVFLGLGVAAAGVGGYFGTQANNHVQAAKDSPFQDEANRELQAAENNALPSNILFGSAGAMGLGALISGIAWGTQGGAR